MKFNISLVLILSIFILSACSGSKKVKSLIDFTPNLVASSNHKVELGSLVKVKDFNDQIKFVQNGGDTIEINPINKFSTKKHNISRSNILNIPVITENSIYLVNQVGEVISYDLKSNKVNWKIKLSTPKRYLSAGTITFGDGKIYVTADLELYVLDAASGKEIIKKTLDDIVKNQTTLWHNAFIVQNVSNKLTVYDINSWTPVWFFETWQESISSSIATSPIALSEFVIAGFSTGQLALINLAEGKDLWQMNFLKDTDDILGASPLNLACQPVVVRNHLYVASNSGNLMKIDIETANIIWKQKVEDIISMSVSGNSIFLTTNARQLAALSVEDGGVIWSSYLNDPKLSQRDKLKPTLFTSPLITNLGIFVFAKDSTGYLLDSNTGGIIKYFNLPKNISSFAIQNDDIILFDNSKSLYLLN